MSDWCAHPLCCLYRLRRECNLWWAGFIMSAIRGGLNVAGASVEWMLGAKSGVNNVILVYT